MSTLPMPPAPVGSAAQQLQAQYSYLFQMAQQLNLALERLEGGGAVRVAAVPTGAAGAAEAPSAAEQKQQYDNLKSLIVRTARQIRSEMDQVRLELAGEYVAQSDFGTYLQKLNSSIAAQPDAMTQYYSFVSDLQADMEAVSAAFSGYRVESEGYIRTGIVSYDGAVPVFGVAVGQDLVVQEVDGQPVVEQKNFRAVFTANKLSFWQDAVEVAYVSNNRLYISNITVLQGVTLGRWEISDRGGLAFQWIGG